MRFLIASLVLMALAPVVCAAPPQFPTPPQFPPAPGCPNGVCSPKGVQVAGYLPEPGGWVNNAPALTTCASGQCGTATRGHVKPNQPGLVGRFRNRR